MRPWKDAWLRRVKQLKAELFALYLVYQDPRTPFHARLFAVCVVAYAFSPIDLIPDFIPVLGYLDDLVLVPLSIALAIRLIPPTVLAESRIKAQELISQGKTHPPNSRGGNYRHLGLAGRAECLVDSLSIGLNSCKRLLNIQKSGVAFP